MLEFVKNIVGIMDLAVWGYILLGVVSAVFVFGIVMMIIKKRPYHVGLSTAIAAILCGALYPVMVAISDPTANVLAISFLLYAGGGILAVIGGVIAMIIKKGRKKTAPAQEQPENNPVPTDAAQPVDNGAYPVPASQFAQAPQYAPAQFVPTPAPQFAQSDVDVLVTRINNICASGAPLSEMREAAVQLQRERAKPENKSNPDTYRKLNDALLTLLNAIQRR